MITKKEAHASLCFLQITDRDDTVLVTKPILDGKIPSGSLASKIGLLGAFYLFEQRTQLLMLNQISLS